MKEYEFQRMRKELLNIKAILDAMQNGTIEVCDDSEQVFDPFNHRYTISTLLAVMRSNVYAALGENQPPVNRV